MNTEEDPNVNKGQENEGERAIEPANPGRRVSLPTSTSNGVSEENTAKGEPGEKKKREYKEIEEEKVTTRQKNIHSLFLF